MQGRSLPLIALFGPLDWAIVLAYFALVITVSITISLRRKRAAGAQAEGEVEYFLGGRSMPTWAVALSLVATMLSAATFVGVPDEAFHGDLSYLALNLGGIAAVFIVALLFVPKLYQAGTVTIYGFLAKRFGESARLAVSCTFILGRMLSSGARLFLASIPLCLLLFGAKQPTTGQMITAICLIGLVGTIYATIGGVRAVVWVDTLQLAIVLGTAFLTIALLLHKIPLSPPQLVSTLAAATAPSGNSKLQLIDTSLSLTSPYTLWAALLGNTFLMTAAYGVDHDLAQRFLITKSASKGAFSVIAAQFLSIAVVALFLLIGLLLYLFYQRPDITGLHPQLPETHQAVYPWFLLNELPTGLAGLSIAGFFAIAQGSLDSAMNALASSIVADVYLPLKKKWRNRHTIPGKVPTAPHHPGDPLTYAPNPNHKAPDSGPDEEAKEGKWTVATVGLLLTAFAILCALTYDPKSKTLLSFALSVMTFGFSGMLAVFLTALLTNRGNSASVIAALLTGALTILLLQDNILPKWTNTFFGHPITIAWPWWMPLATTLAFLVCILGKGNAGVPGGGLHAIQRLDLTSPPTTKDSA